MPRRFPQSRPFNGARLAVLLLLPCLLLCSCKGPSRAFGVPESTTVLEGTTPLPATLHKGLFFVDVSLNGHGPFHLLLDTGAGGIVLSTSAATRAGAPIRPGDDILVEDAAGRGIRQSVAHLGRLDTGGLSLDNLDLVLWPDEDLQRVMEMTGYSFDGVLGMEAFRNAILTLDYPNQQVLVSSRSKAELPDEAPLHYSGVVPRVTVEIGNRRLTAALDTGAQYYLALSDLEQAPLLFPKHRADFPSIQAGGYTRNLRSQLAGDLRLGAAMLRNPPLEESHDNRIGALALARWRVTLDPAERRLWITGNAAPMVWDKEGPLDKEGRIVSIGALLLPHHGRLLVSEVDEGGRGQRAGLLPGDEILSINGNPADLITPETPIPAGLRHRLNILRLGQPFQLTLDLTIR